MPRILGDAPDLAISPDGAWLARLDRGRLRLFSLEKAPPGEPLPAATTEATLPEWPTPGHLDDKTIAVLFSH